MQYKWLWLIPIILLFPIALIIIGESAESINIPPTKAFSKVFFNGEELEAAKYNDELHINTTGSIGSSITDNTIIITLEPISCPFLQGVKEIDENGNMICGVI